MRPSVECELLQAEDQVGMQIDEERFATVGTSAAASCIVVYHRITASYLDGLIAAELLIWCRSFWMTETSCGACVTP